MTDGSVIYGTIRDIEEGVILFNTAFAGDLKIKISDVIELNSTEPVAVKLSDGSVLENVVISLAEDGSSVRTPQTALEAPLDLTEIVTLNPEPWEVGLGYKHEGAASLALVQQRGNSDTDQLDYRIEGKWTGDDDRFSGIAEGELDESDGIKNAENWMLTAKYDRFMGDTSYIGVNSSLKQDEFANLDMRFYLGPYFGRDFFDTKRFNLSAELGLTYVLEKFIDSENQSYPGANWSLDIGSDIFGSDTEFYLKHKGIWDLDNLDEVILDMRFGLKIPLMMNIQAAAEYTIEYDSGAVDGVDEIDQSLKVRFGYRW
jgi:putative salt-induced outer membrane protein YdiY